MSKKSNVNPDHYKTAGRSRQGENIVQDIQTQQYAQSRHDATVHASDAAAKVTTKGKATRPIGKAQKNRASQKKLPEGAIATIRDGTLTQDAKQPQQKNNAKW